ncbi:MAG TPA: glycosyltransferase family 39 protein [Phototrophicaceae bacterium]|nr:glycosyltransferase family 39 protein [Phototrophicaceae bacterium]
MDMQLPMQSVETESGAGRVSLSLEWIAYAAIIAIALIARVAEIDSTPLMASETHNALAAWRAVTPNAAGAALSPTSSVVFVLQSISFALFGGSEVAARLATVIGSLALVLTPLLFRAQLGKTRAFLLTVLLAFSPVLLIASRSSSPDVWALLFALIGLWALTRALASDQLRYSMTAVVMVAALLFLTASGGTVLALILLAAVPLTMVARRGAASSEGEELASVNPAPLRRTVGLTLPFAALVVLAISTGFMLYPAGLSAAGQAVGGAVRALIQPQGMSGYAALISIFYEPILWLLALAGLFLRRDRLTTFDVFLALWLVLGVAAALLFADAVPDHALWLTLPLAALATHTLIWAFTPDARITFSPAPRWARLVIAASTIGVIGVFTLSFQSVARSMIQTPGGIFSAISPSPDSVILVLVALAFLVIGFFLFGSLWGNRTAWQGFVIGLTLFGVLTSFGSGWGAAVPDSDNPVEFWHMNATNHDTTLLRTTLYQVADRISGGFPGMIVYVLAPQDGEVAWLLRDFQHTEFISDVKDAQGGQVVLLPGSIQQPDLGGAYVGEPFTITRSWSTSTVHWIDIPAWWTQTQARTAWTSEDKIVLWLTQNAYEGLNGTTISHTE